MNSPRQQAYHRLLHALLTCESGQEETIVSAHPDLIDAELGRLMEIEAANLAQRGEGEAASRLRNLAGQLFTPPNPSVSGEEQEIGVLFLRQLLWATHESAGNPEVIYPILKQNLDKVNDNLAQILREWATDPLAEADGQSARIIAAIIGNFSNLMQQFRLGSIASNMEIAIAGYEVAQRVFTREAFPKEWAATQNNLGAAYGNRIRGDRAENLERAIAAYQAALQIYTREAFPQNWATAQINLGNAYGDRITGDRAENLEKAIAAYQAALQVRTPTADPIACLETGRNLGNLAFAESRWELAMRGYDTAMQAVEQSREWVTSPRRKREILEAALDVYDKMVRACISAGQLERALETVERSKSRQLVELLANSDLYPKGAPAELKQELNQLRRRISATQQFLAEIAGEEKTAGTSGNLSKEYIQQQRQILEDSQSQLDKLLNQIKEFDPQFTLTQRVEPITFEEIRRLIDSETAILEWHIGTEGFQTFIITGDTLEVVPFASDELQQLEAWKDEYHGHYGKTTWGNSLAERLNTLSQILRLGEIIAKIPPTCRRLVLIPHRYLHLFPLHALPVSPTCRRKTQPATNSETGVINAQGEAFAATNSGGETEVTSANASPLQGYCLLDEFPTGVRYAPSCQLLQLVRNRKRSAAVPRFLFAIQNPTKDLSYADIEVEVIKRDFDPHTHILSGEKATKTALLQNLEILRRTGTAHFSCHGGFNFEFPLSSSLILAESFLPTGGGGGASRRAFPGGAWERGKKGRGGGSRRGK